MRTVFWHMSGPLLRYGRDTLIINDLNPELHVKWRMSRWEAFKTGAKLMLAAISPSVIDGD